MFAGQYLGLCCAHAVYVYSRWAHAPPSLSSSLRRFRMDDAARGSQSFENYIDLSFTLCWSCDLLMCTHSMHQYNPSQIIRIQRCIYSSCNVFLSLRFVRIGHCICHITQIIMSIGAQSTQMSILYWFWWICSRRLENIRLKLGSHLYTRASGHTRIHGQLIIDIAQKNMIKKGSKWNRQP